MISLSFSFAFSWCRLPLLTFFLFCVLFVFLIWSPYWCIWWPPTYSSSCFLSFFYLVYSRSLCARFIWNISLFLSFYSFLIIEYISFRFSSYSLLWVFYLFLRSFLPSLTTFHKHTCNCLHSSAIYFVIIYSLKEHFFIRPTHRVV